MKVCIQFPTFGPYHIARFKAAHQVLQANSIRLVGLEVASSDIAGMEHSAQSTDLPIQTVFKGARVADLSPKEVHQGVSRTLSRINPDVVAITSYSFPDARACLGWCLNSRRGSVLMTASRKEDAERAWWREAVKRVIVSQYGAAVVGGSPQVRYARDLGIPDDHIFKPYDVVDNEFFRRRADAVRSNREAVKDYPGLESDTPFFLASGRMIPRKDYPTMLAAYRLYRSQATKPWNLVILGDGELRGEVERLIEDQAIDGVTLVGRQPHSSLPAYYGLAGAFVHTASIDQWGLVVNEAMASGLPVIVSNGSGCVEDLVQDKGTGYVFASGDIQALATHLRSVSSDETLRQDMSANAREVVAEWSPRKFGEALLNAVHIARQNVHSGTVAGRIALKILQSAARDMTSFHTVQN